MTNMEKINRMKALDALLKDERNNDKRKEYTEEFDRLDKEINDDLEARNMEYQDIKTKLNEIIDEVDELDPGDAKIQTRMTQFNDFTRKLFEKEKSMAARGESMPGHVPVMGPLFTGNLDETIRTYRSKDKKPAYTEPVTTRKGNPAEFRNLFHAVPRESSPFRDAGDFFKAVLSNQADPRLEQRMVAGVGSLGGVVVPTFLVETVLDRALEDEIIRPRAKNYPMTSTKIEIPTFVSYSHTSSRTIGGFIPKWGSETSTASVQDATMSVISMETKYLSLFSSASIPLLTAAPNFENILQDAMSRSVADTLDTVFCAGLGAGTPRGLMADPARITVTRTSAATITYNDLTTMYSRMYPPQLKSAIWLANSSTLPALMSLTNASGNSTYTVQDPNTGAFRILGKEIIFTEKLPEMGTENDIMLVDLTQYAIALVPLILFDRNSAPGWFESVMHYRLALGVDAMGTWESCITTKQGSTQSWLVGLK